VKNLKLRVISYEDKHFQSQFYYLQKKYPKITVKDLDVKNLDAIEGTQLIFTYHERNYTAINPVLCSKQAKIIIPYEEDEIEDVRKATKEIVNILDEGDDGLGLVNKVIDIAIKTLGREPYTTRGVNLDLSDTGGDYPEIDITLIYYG